MSTISLNFLVLMAGLAVLPARAMAEEPAPASPALPDYARYCINIKDAAREARYVLQAERIKTLETQLKDRMMEFEAKQAELQKWMKLRENFIEKARTSLIAIYKTMRPDAAAQQLAMMDELTAAAIILELDTRASSAILNEFDPEKAARLAQVISGAAKTPDAERGA